MSTIPIYEVQMGGGQSIRYVLASDIPPEIATRFMRDVAPCACPGIGGEQDFYAHDWERWCRATSLQNLTDIASRRAGKAGFEPPQVARLGVSKGSASIQFASGA